MTRLTLKEEKSGWQVHQEAEELIVHKRGLIDDFDEVELLKIAGNSHQRRKDATETFQLNKTRVVG